MDEPGKAPHAHPEAVALEVTRHEHLGSLARPAQETALRDVLLRLDRRLRGVLSRGFFGELRRLPFQRRAFTAPDVRRARCLLRRTFPRRVFPLPSDAALRMPFVRCRPSASAGQTSPASLGRPGVARQIPLQSARFRRSHAECPPLRDDAAFDAVRTDCRPSLPPGAFHRLAVAQPSGHAPFPA